MRQRNRACEEAKAKDTPTLWATFQGSAEQSVASLRQAKETFFASLTGKIKNLKTFWKGYHSISSDHQHVPPTLSNRKRTSAEKANLLNKLFVSSAPGQATDHTHTNHVLARLQSDVATGPDGISSKMLTGTSALTSDNLQPVTSTINS